MIKPCTMYHKIALGGVKPAKQKCGAGMTAVFGTSAGTESARIFSLRSGGN